MPKTQQEIVAQGYQALVESLGVVDAIHFVQYLTIGQGNYTAERDQWLREISLENLLEQIKQSNHSTQEYDEIID